MRLRRPLRFTAVVLGLALVLATSGFAARALIWEHHATASGDALIASLRAAQASVGRAATSSAPASTNKPGPCTGLPPAAGPRGLLVAPSIHLVAPVLEGTANAQLDVAVGHAPNSVWPGAAGNAVLLAHDVSYFVHLDALKIGELVEYETACTIYAYRVAAHAVVKAGTPVYDTKTATMTLVTCWPTDALWYTPDRYLVSLVEVGHAPLAAVASPGTVRRLPHLARALPLHSAAPPALVGEGLTLATNSVPMGTFQTAGRPAPSWVASPGPLAVEATAIENYLGALKSLAASRLDWFALLAPGLAPPAPLVGASSVGYLAPMQVRVTAAGRRVESATLSSTVLVSGGPAAGDYLLRVEMVARGSLLEITSFGLRPFGA